MIKYGPKSRAQLDTLHPTLARVLYDYADLAPPELDLSVVCGHRGEAEQNKAYREGASTKQWPNSKHNAQPSRAFDFKPHPFPDAASWKDLARFARIAGALQLVASQRGIALRWGGDWDRDGATIDERFVDAGHLELADPE